MRRRCTTNVSLTDVLGLDGFFLLLSSKNECGRYHSGWRRLRAGWARGDILRANRPEDRSECISCLARNDSPTTILLSSPPPTINERFREVMYLRALSFDGIGHPNIIKLRDVIRANNDRDLYMTFEYSETDLSRVIKARVLEPAVSST